MKTTACLILVLLVNLPGRALSQEPVYFADSNLKAAVEEALGISNPTPDDMLGLFFLDASSRGIVDLTGLEYATNLLELELAVNKINDISALSRMYFLYSLGLSDNRITDISPLSGFTPITSILWLDLSYNQITNISELSGLTNVTSLFLNNNQISDISVLSEFYFLFLLDLRHNPLNEDAYEIYIPLIYDNNLLLHPFWWPIDYDPFRYYLTIESSIGGSVTNPGEGTVYYYDQESIVELEATKEDFITWSGTAVDAGKVADPDSPTTTVIVDNHYTLQAHFASEWSFAIITDCHIGEHCGECIHVNFPIFGDKYWCDYSDSGWDDVSREDNHKAAIHLERVVELINSKKDDYNIEFVVILGDLSDSAEISEFVHAKKILDGLTIPWLPLIGNHDVWPKVPPKELLSWEEWLLEGLPWDIDLAAPSNANPNLDGENGPDVYFNNIFGPQYINFVSDLVPDLSNWKEEEYMPVWNTTLDPYRYNYFQNFAFDYKGYHFVGLDFNHRDWHTLPLPGWPFDAELHDFGEGGKYGSWKWFKEHLDEYNNNGNKGNENIILFAHHPFRIIHSDELQALPFNILHPDELQELGLVVGELNQQLDGGFDEDEMDKINGFLRQYRSHIWCQFAGHTHKNTVHNINYGDDIIDIIETSATVVTPLVRLVQFHSDGKKDCSVILQAEREANENEEQMVYGTDNFLIYYYTVCNNAVDISDENDNHVPDFVEDVGKAFEDAHSYLIGILGFENPSYPTYSVLYPDKYAVYIIELGADKCGETKGYYPFVDYTYININSRLSTTDPPASSYVMRGNEVDSGLICSVAAHEYFHAIQFRTFGWFMIDSLAISNKLWVPEGSSQWAGYKTFINYYLPTEYPDAENEFTNTVIEGYLVQTDRSLFESGYSAGLYWYYIDKKFGTSKINEIWSYFNDALGSPLIDFGAEYAIDMALADKDYDFEKSFKDFSKENYFWELYDHVKVRSPFILNIGQLPYSNIHHLPERATSYFKIIASDVGNVRININDPDYDSKFFARAYPNENSQTEVIIPINKSIEIAGHNTVIIVDRFAGLNPLAEDAFEINVAAVD